MGTKLYEFVQSVCPDPAKAFIVITFCVGLVTIAKGVGYCTDHAKTAVLESGLLPSFNNSHSMASAAYEKGQIQELIEEVTSLKQQLAAAQTAPSTVGQALLANPLLLVSLTFFVTIFFVLLVAVVVLYSQYSTLRQSYITRYNVGHTLTQDGYTGQAQLQRTASVTSNQGIPIYASHAHGPLQSF